MKQIPLPLEPDLRPGFDSFVPGEHNTMALQHLRALAPGAAPSISYLWGASGSGKTHLIESLRRAFEPAPVAWFDAASPAPWACDDAARLIVLDDCDAFDADQQHAAFALFVEAATRALPLVAAGRLPPVDLPLREDLRTRLGWGHVLALRPLSEADSRAVLRRSAERRGLKLPDELLDHLMTRFARDLKHLVALLDRLDQYARVHRRAITLPLLRQMLAEGEPPDHAIAEAASR